MPLGHPITCRNNNDAHVHVYNGLLHIHSLTSNTQLKVHTFAYMYLYVCLCAQTKWAHIQQSLRYIVIIISGINHQIGTSHVGFPLFFKTFCLILLSANIYIQCTKMQFQLYGLVNYRYAIPDSTISYMYQPITSGCEIYKLFYSFQPVVPRPE